MQEQEEIITRLMQKYDYLAVVYASQIRGGAIIGLDKEDLIQEFRIKLYNTIIAYGVSLVEWDNKERAIQPIASIRVYIKTCLKNYKNEFFKKIEIESKIISREVIPAEDLYEIGHIQEVEPSRNSYVNGVFIYEGMKGKGLLLFKDFITSSEQKITVELCEKYGFSLLEGKSIINSQREYLQKRIKSQGEIDVGDNRVFIQKKSAIIKN